jgi:hypothetical protein
VSEDFSAKTKEVIKRLARDLSNLDDLIESIDDIDEATDDQMCWWTTAAEHVDEAARIFRLLRDFTFEERRP